MANHANLPNARRELMLGFLKSVRKRLKKLLEEDVSLTRLETCKVVYTNRVFTILGYPNNKVFNFRVSNGVFYLTDAEGNDLPDTKYQTAHKGTFVKLRNCLEGITRTRSKNFFDVERLEFALSRGYLLINYKDGSTISWGKEV